MISISGIIFTLGILRIGAGYEALGERKWPTVVVSTLVRNKGHTLPYFLKYLNALDYPKDRMSLWIRSDHNQDNSIEIMKKWLHTYKHKYHSVDIMFNETSPTKHFEELGPAHWGSSRFNHIINLRQEAIEYAGLKWCDHLFILDADVFLTNPNVLKDLISKKYDVVSPMLISDSTYSNFWCGMSSDYYYERTDEYIPILEREKKGCFQVPMIHTAVLINMRSISSNNLTYIPANVLDYNGPNDDIITFAISANKSGIPLYICNEEIYGYLPIPLTENQPLEADYDQICNLKMESISRGLVLSPENILSKYVSYPKPSMFGFDKIYMINLERRTERLNLMRSSFRELGIDATVFEAIDGKAMSQSDLKKLNLKMLPGYEDPFHKRPMKLGEIGCLLSHYFIWEEVVKLNYEKVIIFEDDVTFTGNFRQKFNTLLEQMDTVKWDLVYIGRKTFNSKNETFVTSALVRPDFSYWTLGYILSGRGARKLLAGRPLQYALPVDEYIPIMYNRHSNNTWKSFFPKRDLIALSAWPLLVYPTHYTGQIGYVSDTEDSSVVNIQPVEEVSTIDIKKNNLETGHVIFQESSFIKSGPRIDL